MLYGKYKNVYYKNRPKPVPKRMRKYLKSDCVLDERNHTVSIAEYNYKHGTDYTLEDVYGKKYIACIFHTLGKKPLIDEWHTPAKAVFSFYDKSLQP